jgi:hypothetical protein
MPYLVGPNLLSRTVHDAAVTVTPWNYHLVQISGSESYHTPLQQSLMREPVHFIYYHNDPLTVSLWQLETNVVELRQEVSNLSNLSNELRQEVSSLSNFVLSLSSIPIRELVDKFLRIHGFNREHRTKFIKKNLSQLAESLGVGVGHHDKLMKMLQWVILITDKVFRFIIFRQSRSDGNMAAHEPTPRQVAEAVKRNQHYPYVARIFKFVYQKEVDEVLEEGDEEPEEDEEPEGVEGVEAEDALRIAT